MTWPQYLRHRAVVHEPDPRSVRLTPHECELLLLFILRPNTLLSYEDIISFVWSEPDSEPDWAKSSVQNLVDKLRRCKKIPIVSRAGFGYLYPL